MDNDQLTQLTWPEAAPPEGHVRCAWTPSNLRALPRVRREFRIRIADMHGTRHEQDDSSEDAVAVLDELMSKALRHGRAPVTVEIRQAHEGLVLMVGDHAADDPPQPTNSRDPVHGGMGLGIIARTSLAHGWTSHHDIKIVWALMRG